MAISSFRAGYEPYFLLMWFGSDDDDYVLRVRLEAEHRLHAADEARSVHEGTIRRIAGHSIERVGSIPGVSRRRGCTKGRPSGT